MTDLQTPPGIDAGELAMTPGASVDDAVAATRAWVEAHVPAAWREAAEQGGREAIRQVRKFADYESWYPTFARSGLAVATWPVAYGGLDLKPAVARAVEGVLAPYNLGRLNPLGLNLAAPALFAFGTEEQRLRFLPPMVRNEEIWCQLFSEPGAGSDLASLACKAERDGDEWVLTGQKVWSTWAHNADYGVTLARTDPDAPEAQGHQLLPARPAPARCRGPGPAPHHRRDRLQRDLPRRRPRARLQPGR